MPKRRKGRGGSVCRVTDGPSGKITCAFVYSSTHNLTGTIRPGETVIRFDERIEPGGPYSNIFWRGGCWWLHSAFLEEE